MISDQITRRLRWHAGFEEGDEEGILSISVGTSADGDDGRNLPEAFADFLSTLGALNREMNGDVPSETFVSIDAIPTDIAYAVAEVARQLRDYQVAAASPSKPDSNIDWEWRADTAWAAVLAGDIDDLEQHLRDEEAVRRS